MGQGARHDRDRRRIETEVTAFSVITEYENGIKYPLADFNITPDVAIVDPELTCTVPAKLCAHAGIAHSLARKTGAAFTGDHSIHGCANAMYLGKVIQSNAKDE